MTTKQLEQKLNKEYEEFGKILLQDMYTETVLLSKIKYIHTILDNVKPNSNNEPIILIKVKDSDRYCIFDGYHRLKYRIENGDRDTKAIILDKYRIDRHDDEFAGFIKKTVGKKIQFTDNSNLIVNNHLYNIVYNEGCSGCDNGWSDIKIVDKYIDKKIFVKKIEIIPVHGSQDEYTLLINGDQVALVDTGWGNGYYGGDFEIVLVACKNKY